MNKIPAIAILLSSLSTLSWAETDQNQEFQRIYGCVTKADSDSKDIFEVYEGPITEAGIKVSVVHTRLILKEYDDGVCGGSTPSSWEIQSKVLLSELPREDNTSRKESRTEFTYPGKNRPRVVLFFPLTLSKASGIARISNIDFECLSLDGP